MQDSDIQKLADLLGQALPLAVRMVAVETPPRQRAALREAMDDGALFDLSNCLDALCGERAWQMTTARAVEFSSNAAQQAAEGLRFKAET